MSWKGTVDVHLVVSVTCRSGMVEKLDQLDPPSEDMVTTKKPNSSVLIAGFPFGKRVILSRLAPLTTQTRFLAPATIAL